MERATMLELNQSTMSATKLPLAKGFPEQIFGSFNHAERVSERYKKLVMVKKSGLGDISFVISPMMEVLIKNYASRTW